MTTSATADDATLIRTAIADRLGGECRIEGPLAVDGTARIFRLTVGPDGRRFAAKLCRDPADAQRQFAALTQAVAAMSGPENKDLRVPRPLTLAEAEGLLVMEWIDGRSLADLLRVPRVRPAVVLDGAARAGAWLARYHATGPVDAAPFDHAGALARLEQALDVFGVAGEVPAVARAWLDRLRRAARVAVRRDLPIRLHHGDFKPANVLLAGNAVYGIDLHSQYHSSVAQDIVHFLVDLELACFHPLGWRLLPWRRALVRRFLAGYDIGRWRGLDEVVAWLRLHEIARTWASFHAERPLARRRAYAAACLRLMARASPHP